LANHPWFERKSSYFIETLYSCLGECEPVPEQQRFETIGKSTIAARCNFGERGEMGKGSD